MTEKLTDHPEHIQPIEIPLAGDLLLRQVTAEDSQAMYDLISRNGDHLSQHGDDTARKYPNLEAVRERNESQSENELRFCIWDTSINTNAHFFERHKPRLAGFIKLTQDPDVPVEVGYYLDEGQQHKGVMVRCVRAVTRLAIDGLGKEKVMAKVALTNEPSLKVLQKAGYKIVSQDDEQYTLEYKEEPGVPVFYSKTPDPKLMNADNYKGIEAELLEAAESLGFSQDEVLFSGQSRLGSPTISEDDERGSTHFGDVEALRIRMPDSLHGNPITFALLGLYGVISIYDRSKLELNAGNVNNDRGIWTGTWVRRGGLKTVMGAKIGELRLANRLVLPQI